MARIALVKPLVSGQAEAPYSGQIGLSFVYSFMKRQGHEVLYMDANFADHETFFRRVVEFKPDYMGVSVDDYCLETTPHFMKRVREESPTTIHVVGGPEVTEFPEKVLRLTGADFAVVGEGTVTLQHIILGELDNPGIAYLREGEFVSNGMASYTPENWKADPDNFKPGKKTYSALSAAGCSKTCNFCTVKTVFPKVVKRPLDDVIADMAAIASRMNTAEFFLFNDDNFLIYPDRLIEIDAAMQAAGLPHALSFQASADYVLRAEPQLRQASKRVNIVCMGIESFLDTQLAPGRYGKGTTGEQGHQAIELLRSIGMNPGIFMIVGDRHTTMDEAVDFAQVFADHPEYLLLLSDVNVMSDHTKEDCFEGVPDFVQLLEYFYKIIMEETNSIYMGPAHRGFLRGLKVPEKMEREVGLLLGGALDTANKFRLGEIGHEQAKDEMKDLAVSMNLKLSHLYCTSHAPNTES